MKINNDFLDLLIKFRSASHKIAFSFDHQKEKIDVDGDINVYLDEREDSNIAIYKNNTLWAQTKPNYIFGEKDTPWFNRVKIKLNFNSKNDFDKTILQNNEWLVNLHIVIKNIINALVEVLKNEKENN